MRIIYKSKILFILIIALSLNLFSCSSDDAPLPTTPEEILSYGNWLMSDFYLEESVALNGTEVDLHITEYDQIQKCDQDNIFIFNNEGAFEIMGNAIKCSSFETEIIKTGVWKVDEESNLLFVTGENILKRGDDGHTGHSHGNDPFEGNKFNFEILEINLETLVLKISKIEEETTNSGFLVTKSAIQTISFTNNNM